MTLVRLLATGIAAAAIGTVGYTVASHTQTQSPSSLTVAKASGYMKGYETLSWAPSALATGFVLYRDGVKVSTAGASATSARFYLSAGTHTISAVATLQSPTTTAPTATTAPTTTSPSSSSYEQAIAYAQTPPSFTVQRDVPVATSSQLLAAVAAIRCGDRVHATGSFIVTSEWQITAAPACPAVVDLHGVTLAYTGSSALPSVWINGAANLQLFGGDIHGPPAGQPGAGGVLVYKATTVLWWGFHVHDVAHDGLDLFPVGGPIDGCDFQGEIDHWGGYIADDPHAEKGTGYHGANLVDAGTGIVTNTRVALDLHDGPTGAGVEIGDGSSSARISGITLYLRARDLTKAASSQVAGNAIQWWGAVPIQMTIPYLEATDLQGRATDGQGVYAGVSMHGITVAYGHAANTNLNPQLSRTESGIAASDPWDKRHGEVYLEVK